MKSDFRSKEMKKVLPGGLKGKKPSLESLGNKVRVFQLWLFISSIFQIHIYFNISTDLRGITASAKSTIPEEAVSGANDRLQLNEERFQPTKVN